MMAAEIEIRAFILLTFRRPDPPNRRWTFHRDDDSASTVGYWMLQAH
jgi:hypothetical protein